MAKRRPLFSIIVPCYNDGQYCPGQYIDRVLNSICNQGLTKSETEVIVVDDHSRLPYNETLDIYKNKLNITYIESDYSSCPGNTRQKGSEYATGKWICFIDHDDEFYDGSLKVVKDAIKATDEQYVTYTDFNKVDPENNMNIVEEFKGSSIRNWIHGKFYNVDNFWKPMGIHFVKDLITHEDHALNKIVECAMTKLKIKPLYLSCTTYKWIYNKESLSHSRYFMPSASDLSVFLASHFDDYLTANIRSVLECYSSDMIDKGTASAIIIPAFVSAWQSLSTFKSKSTLHYSMINDAYCGKVWNEVKEILGLNVLIFKSLLSKVFPDLDKQVKEYAKSQTVSQSFIEWMVEIDGIKFSDIISELSNLTEDYDRLPDNSSEHRPFFSCIIPCYNDGRYKDGVYLDRLLSSLTRQNTHKEDIEVILSDDCSPVPFFDKMLDKYGDKLTLKYIKTDYNCCPGNTRGKGVTIATGRWLCFADHDDIYYDNAFEQVRNSIESKNEKHFIFGDFNGVDTNGKVLKKYECSLNWCHAKFYNKDNFWDKYGIHFIKDLKSHEDIAICTQVGCALSANVPNYTYIRVPLYAWTDNPQSVSHAKYTVETETGPREFLEVFYGDYIRATGYTFLEQYSNHRIRITYAIKSVIEIMCYAYFYQQSFMFRRPNDYYARNLSIAGAYINECKKAFNLTNESIYNVVAADRASMYYAVNEQAKMATGQYMPSLTFKQWLGVVSPE